MNVAVAISLLLLLGLLTLVSYVDRVYQEAGRFLSRDFQDNIDAFEQKVEPRLRVSRTRASLSMAVLAQLTMAAIALLVGFVVFSDQEWTIYEILQAAISLILIVIVFNRILAVRVLLAHQGRLAGSLDTGLEDADLPCDAGDDRAGFPSVGGFADQAERDRATRELRQKRWMR